MNMHELDWCGKSHTLPSPSYATGVVYIPPSIYIYLVVVTIATVFSTSNSGDDEVIGGHKHVNGSTVTATKMVRSWFHNSTRGFATSYNMQNQDVTI